MKPRRLTPRLRTKASAKIRPRVLILHTGGTVGMELVENQSRLSKGFPEELEARFRARAPELEALADIQVETLFNADSAHLGPGEWLTMARAIQRHARDFDGFVLLHGTDTLAYTASALSILLQGLKRPVVITGAMRPLYALRTDARRNLIAAVEMLTLSTQKGLSGVTVFFDDTLFAGHTVRKVSAIEFSAFSSPKDAVLAKVGTEVEFLRPLRRPSGSAPRIARLGFSERVALLHVTPGFPSNSYVKILAAGVDGVVLVLFGSATAPTHSPEFIMFLKQAQKKGIPVVCVTEGPAGRDLSDYEAGRALKELGCVWAGSETLEYAFVKTSFLLGSFSKSQLRGSRFAKLYALPWGRHA